MRSVARLVACAVALAALLGSARGDIIHLKTGRVEGVILKKTETELVVQTAAGKVTLNPADVVSIERKAAPLEVYREQAAKVGEKDADGHFALGLWCTDQKLFGEAHKEFERAAAIDPDHKGAREKLGYVLKDGKWMTRAEAKKADGFVKLGDAWVTPEQRDAAQRREAANACLRRLRAAVAKGPATVDAVTKRLMTVLGDKSGEAGQAALRALLAEMTKAALEARRDRDYEARIAVLDLIRQDKSPDALDTLRRAALQDPHDSVRAVATKTLAAQKSVDNVAYFVGLLREYTGPRYRLNGDRRARNLARRALRRAAEALGELGDPRAVPALADTLIVRFYISENADEIPPMSMGFNRYAGGPAGVYTDSSGNQYVVPSGETTNWGLGPNEPERDTEDPVFFNEQAYNALRKLTGQDFSHDKRAWLAWWYRNRYNYED